MKDTPSFVNRCSKKSWRRRGREMPTFHDRGNGNSYGTKPRLDRASSSQVLQTFIRSFVVASRLWGQSTVAFQKYQLDRSWYTSVSSADHSDRLSYAFTPSWWLAKADPQTRLYCPTIDVLSPCQTRNKVEQLCCPMLPSLWRVAQLNFFVESIPSSSSISRSVAELWSTRMSMNFSYTF